MLGSAQVGTPRRAAHLLRRERLLLERGVELVEPAQAAALAVAATAQALRRGAAGRGGGRVSQSGRRHLLCCTVEAAAHEAANELTAAAHYAHTLLPSPTRRPRRGRGAEPTRTLAIRLQFCGPYVCTSCTSLMSSCGQGAGTGGGDDSTRCGWGRPHPTRPPTRPTRTPPTNRPPPP